MNQHQKNLKYARYNDAAMIGLLLLLITVIGTVITASIVQIDKEEDNPPAPTETIAPNNTQDPLPEENLTGQPG